MAIEIGKPQPVLGLSGKAATALKVSGIIALGYGVLCTAGLIAEMANYTDVAQMIYQAVEPVVKSGSELFKAVAEMAGAIPMPGDVMGDAPQGIKVGTSGMFMTGVGGGLVLVGAKLSEMVKRAESMAMAATVRNYGPDNGNTYRPAPSDGNALSM